jgi:hypothetical protein
MVEKFPAKIEQILADGIKNIPAMTSFAVRTEKNQITILAD